MKPRKITPEAEQRVYGALAAGGDLALAAKLINCTRQALHKHLSTRPDLKEEWDSAKAVADERVVKSLFDSALGGNVTAMIFWLKNRRPEQWRDRPESRPDDSRGAVRDLVDRIHAGEFQDAT